MTPHTQDDAFHEIQLNGKQLVFLFMATTVVSIVIFLCGVLVGRGVRAERSGTVADAAFGALAAADAGAPQPSAAPTPSLSDPTAAAAPAAVDNLGYFNRLENPNRSAEDLKLTPATEPAASAETAAPSKPRAAPPPAAKEPSGPPSARRAERVFAQPAGQGYAVQVAALNLRSEAEAIAKRLTSKGYVAYVLPPGTGTPAVYRVRVGKFGTRHEAETVAAKLQKEEQFKPWITR